MKIIPVNLEHNAYKIMVGSKTLGNLGARLKALKIGQDAVIITNPLVRRHYGALITKALKAQGFTVKILTVADGEQSKSLPGAFALMEAMAKYDVFKRLFVVALGGGVIGDLAGYVAAAYKRGIPYVQVPTTFLAQIDSAIGGKVGVDLPIGKNLVGAFYQPRLVYSDVEALSTLDPRQIRNGLAEAVKYGVIYDEALFTYIARHSKELLNKDLRALSRVVVRSSQIKAEVVLADEKETKNIRTILNFGHTLGHAVEAAGQYTLYQHGEAIALGMRMAGRISRQMGFFSEENEARLNQVLTDIGLPTRVKALKAADILRVMKYDKKFVAGTNRFVLARKIGTVTVKDNIPQALIQKAIRAYL